MFAVLLTTAVLAFQETQALRLRELAVPAVVIKGDPVWLNCSFDLEGDKLYSIKWHKNNVEFYRYLPEHRPPGRKYELSGIYIDLSKCSEGFLYMYHTDVDSEGIYRCEVSAEAPSFQTVKAEREMRIYVFPRENPRIFGTREHYRVGDIVNVVCVTGPSRPAAFLKWWINGNQAPKEYLIKSDPEESPDGLLTSRLRLRFTVTPDHFHFGGSMRLRCEAAIAQAHTLSSEEISITSNSSGIDSPQRLDSVYDSPKDGPTITGGRAKYQVGDVVDLNCTASKSQPPAELQWYINDKEVRPDQTVKRPPIRYTDGQESTVLGLRFNVKQRHFVKGEMRLRCTAMLSEVTRMSSEELEVDNQQQISGLHVYENARAVSSNSDDIRCWNHELRRLLLFAVIHMLF